jgi:uncharacterized protein (TIGR02001 family)
MKRLLPLFITLVLFILINGKVLSQTDSVENNNYSFEVESTFSSKYVWRGIIYNEGLVFQPAITVNKDNWGAQIWSNLPLHDLNQETFQKEIDFYLWYNLQLGELTISPTIMYYTYPGQDANSTGEIGFSLFYPIDNFDLSSSVNMDFKEIGGAFSFQHDITYNNSLNDNLDLSIIASVGWADKKFNNYYIGIEKVAVNYFQTNISLKYMLSENISLKPFVENYRILDSQISEIIKNNFFNMGITFNLEI